MYKVSICIPAYNNLSGIIRLLNSIIIQDYDDYEVIITDDSESNEIAGVINQFKKLNIKYYKNPYTFGSTANWNEAINKASGEYIKIMHHDDWFTDSHCLGRFVEMLDNNPHAIMAFSGTIQVEPTRQYARSIDISNVETIRKDYRNLFLGNKIGAPSAVIHRRTEIRYDTNLKWLVDMEFYMHLLQSIEEFVYTKDPLISIGVSANQLTESCIRDKALNRFEYRYIMKRYNLQDDIYKEKITDILLLNDGSYSEAKDCGINRWLFYFCRMKHFLNKVYNKLKYLIGAKRRTE